MSVLPAAASATGRLHPAVLIYLLTIAFPVEFKVGTLSLSGMRVILLIMVIPLFANLMSGKYGKLILTDYLFPMHIFWAMVALGVNNPNRVVENIGSAAVEFLGGYLLGRAFIRTPADFIALCRVLIVMVICWVPFTLYEAKTGKPVILDAIGAIPGVTTYFDVHSYIRLGMERSQVVFAHPIHFGLFCSVVFSLCFVAFKTIYPAGKRYVSTAFIGLCIFLSLSSGALLALILQIGMISWSFIFRNSKRKWMLLLGFFAFLYVLVDLLSNRTPLKVLMSYATFSAHTAYWRSIIFDWGMINVWKHPIFGLGLRDWERPYYMYSGSMDNFWLVMAVRYGIPGFLTIAIGYAEAIRRVGTRDFTADPMVSQFRLAWVFTFLGLSFTLSTVHIWTSIYSFVFFMLGAGLWMVDYRPSDNVGQPDAEPQSGKVSPYARSASTQRNRRDPGSVAGSSMLRPVSAPQPVSVQNVSGDGAAGPETGLRADGARYSRFLPDGGGEMAEDSSSFTRSNR